MFSDDGFATESRKLYVSELRVVCAEVSTNLRVSFGCSDHTQVRIRIAYAVVSTNSMQTPLDPGD